MTLNNCFGIVRIILWHPTYNDQSFYTECPGPWHKTSLDILQVYFLFSNFIYKIKIVLKLFNN